MPDAPLVKLRPELVEGVAIIDILAPELNETSEAPLFSMALRSIADQGISNRYVINAAATKYVGSSFFAVLLSFGLRTIDAGGKVVICSMDPFVRDEANIIKFGRILPIIDDESAAIAAVRE